MKLTDPKEQVDDIIVVLDEAIRVGQDCQVSEEIIHKLSDVKNLYESLTPTSSRKALFDTGGVLSQLSAGHRSVWRRHPVLAALVGEAEQKASNVVSGQPTHKHSNQCCSPRPEA